MGPISWLAERRQQRILAYVDGHLEEGEDVLYWVRARPAEGRAEGFAYLTNSRWVVFWQGSRPEAGSVRWDEIQAWGLAEEHSGSPVLGIEAGERSFYVELPAASHQVAGKVRDFLRCFAELAPRPGRRPRGRSHNFRLFDATGLVEVTPQRKSLARRTRMVIVTVAGAGLLGVGVVLLFLPGPGFLLVIGGLALLSTEFDWAKDGLSWAQDKYRSSRRRLGHRRPADPE